MRRLTVVMSKTLQRLFGREELLVRFHSVIFLVVREVTVRY
jgi:hypothetical protein